MISENVNCHIHVLTGIGEDKHPLFNKEIIEKIRGEFKNAINHIGSPKYSFGNLPAAMLNEIPTYLVNKEVKSIVDKIKPILSLLHQSMIYTWITRLLIMP